MAVVGVLLVPYYLGVVAALIVLPYRVGSSPAGAYITAFAHPESRRNGIPWVIKTVAKAVAWPVVLWLWNRDGRQPTRELFGDAAAEKLGLPSGHAFATRWRA